MKVLFVKGKSRNDVLRVLTDRLSHEFSLLNDKMTVDIFDILNYNGTINDYFSKLDTYDVILSFNTTGEIIDVQGVDGKKHSLFSLLSKRQVFWMVDDPVYHLSPLQAPNPNRITIFTSDLHTNIAHALGFDGVFTQTLSAGYVNPNTKPHALRAFDVAVAASWMGDADNFWLGYDLLLQKVIEETISCVDGAVVCNAYPIFTQKLEECDLSLTEKQLQQILPKIHSYIRKKDRVLMIQKIVDAGLSVALIGTGWKSIFAHRHNVTYFEDINYSDIKKIYEDARVVVNLNAENGACERVFDGIESGAMIFSDFSNALYRAFSHDQGVLFFQKYKADESISGLLRMIKQNETQGFAEQAQKIVLAGHTWQHRAQALYQLLRHSS